MDRVARIVEAVNDARQSRRGLSIAGSGSKRNWLPQTDGELLVMNEHAGIVAYDPAELVITARAGTPIRVIADELSRHEQTLAFEPPQFFASGTLGGMLSAGLSGPARPWCGSVRDAVLGVEMINGLGERLTFGGQVMKNVAGYDISRLMTGACGALGPILQASVRVQPARDFSLTLRFALDAGAANELCRQLAGRYLPLTGTWWNAGLLSLRLAGSEAGVLQAAESLGGDRVQPGNLWQDVRDHSAPFFKASDAGVEQRAGQKLWRIVVPAAAPMPAAQDDDLAVEWAGGLRWWWHEDASEVAAYAAACNGWAWSLGDQQPIDGSHRSYMAAIKAAFDPDNIFVSAMNLRPSDAH